MPLEGQEGQQEEKKKKNLCRRCQCSSWKPWQLWDGPLFLSELLRVSINAFGRFGKELMKGAGVAGYTCCMSSSWAAVQAIDSTSRLSVV